MSKQTVMNDLNSKLAKLRELLEKHDANDKSQDDDYILLLAVCCTISLLKDPDPREFNAAAPWFGIETMPFYDTE